MAQKALLLDEIQRTLSSQRFGSKIHYFRRLNSTNVTAQRLAGQGVPEGEIVVAEEQTQGKGRLGRRWSSPPYTNLYLSLILRPKLPPAHIPQITLMAAVALADTVGRFASLDPEIKWPNDLLVGGKKMAGILTESSCDSDRVSFVVLGLGVNLNYPKAQMPEEIRNRATSLLEVTGRPVERSTFAARLIHNLDQCYGILEECGFAAISGRWQEYFRLCGRQVRVDMPGTSTSGKAVGIDTDGALILEGNGGGRHRILAGDVVPL